MPLLMPIRRFAGLARLFLHGGVPQQAMRNGANLGRCPICERSTVFFRAGDYPREHYLCARCRSIPRFRAIIHVLQTHFPDWRDRRVHESSPGGGSSDKLARECRRYTPTQYFPDTRGGAFKDGVRCEDLERQTFADGAFDLVITQDVFEHIFDAGRAFAEIARTLAPGGAHVFTVPWFYWKPTLLRAVRENGEVRHLEPPDYHGNPIDAKGSLVVREWGRELIDCIYRDSGLTTTAVRLFDRSRGLEAQFLEVFISQKIDPAAPAGHEATIC